MRAAAAHSFARATRSSPNSSNICLAATAWTAAQPHSFMAAAAGGGGGASAPPPSAPPPDGALSEAQAAVYDRQLRVWGLEVQNRWAQGARAWARRTGRPRAAAGQLPTLPACPPSMRTRLSSAKVLIIGGNGLAAEVRRPRNAPRAAAPEGLGHAACAAPTHPPHACALRTQVAKNIVLAGVGHVAVADATPCSAAPFGNFLVPADAEPSAT